MIFRCAIVVCSVFLLAPIFVSAADSDIAINEIAAYEPSDYEWVEIYNKGSAVVDITGWKFFEANTNHSLTAYRGDFVIEPGEYAIIANKADKIVQKYPSFTGTLIDSSWSSLSESGELIALKSAGGTTIEQFTYIAAPDYSLERKNPLLVNYTSANWQEHASENTIGAQNTNYSLAQDSPESPLSRPRRADILINEFVSDPVDKEQEWIELLNATARAIDLSGWRLINGSGAAVLLSGTFDFKDNGKYRVISLTSGFLLNAGDKILLQTPEHATIDQVTYGNFDDGDLSDNAPVAVDPHSLSRIGTSYSNREDFRITETPTKGAANSIIDTRNTQIAQPSRAVMITEVVPNPVSSEPAHEFIELYNPNEDAVSIEGWELVLLNGLKYLFPPGEMLKPKSYRAYGRDVTNLSLRNTGGERVRLYAPHASLYTDEVRYAENALLGMSYARDAGGAFYWTKTITSGEKNIIAHDNRAPKVVIDGPFAGIGGDPLTFDASDTVDQDGDPLTFSWSFGDGTQGEGPRVHHRYREEDAYSIILMVSDGKTSVAQFHHVVITDRGASQVDSALVATQAVESVNSADARRVSAQKTSSLQTLKSAEDRSNLPPEIARRTSPSAVRSLKSGTRVQVDGVVSVAPNIINASYFYIAGSGIQIWNPNKQFPPLERGDRVFITGTVRKNGQERAIKITRIQDIAIKERVREPEARATRIADIAESFEGQLVRLTGAVADIRWPNVYLEDGDARARVYVSKNTRIEKGLFSKGGTITVIGIVGQTSAGYRVLPRDMNDVVIAQADGPASGERTNTELQVITIPPHENPRTSMMRYFWVTLIAAVALAGGLFLQHYLDRKKQK